ncbi:histidinol-phosphatase [Bifidobacterium sp.]|uniref:histidinol-phosphatase n=1 Tax=Bifidobacterium sp. TaxID=41200 RepID=UPI0039E837E8
MSQTSPNSSSVDDEYDRPHYRQESFEKELAANPYREDLLLALQMADEADKVTSARFGALDLHIEDKPDHTPVTDADRETEATLRGIIERNRPGDSVYGEELGKAESTGRRWILDPIDGTKNFVRGVPVWATLIGLEVDHELVVGVVSSPFLHNRWFAAQGGGAFMGMDVDHASRIHVSKVSRLEHASMSLSSLSGWKERGDRNRLIELTDRLWRLRGFGDFWQYMLVAQGAIDIAAEPELDLYDMAALVPIVTEAGGSFTDLQGNPGPWGGCGVATNGPLHEQVLDYLRL